MTEDLMIDLPSPEMDRPDVTVRLAGPDDAESIVNVYKNTWSATYPDEELNITDSDIAQHTADWDGPAGIQRVRDVLADPSPFTAEMVAEVNGNIVGTSRLLLTSDDNENKITGFYVLPDYHGSGVAQALMASTLSYLGNDKPVSLEVTAHTDKAVSFYQKMGFAIAEHAGPVVMTLNNGKMMPGYKMVRPAGAALPENPPARS
jgi:ribosomal protein S18 acetylase RimI-like enzyme